MQTRPTSLFLVLTLMAVGLRSGHAAPVSFRKDIAPVLLNHCLACHGPKKAEGNYRIDTFERLMQPGDSGLTPFSANDLEDSETYRRIISEEVDERMPLEGDPLEEEQVALIEQWIDEGAKYDGDDPQEKLSKILPPPEHPAPPESYAAAVPITAVAFSTDGSELLVGGYHEVSVWNASDGQLVRRIKNVGQRTYAISLNPAGEQLAVGCGAPGQLGEVRIFDAKSGKLETVLGTATDVVLDVQFSPDGQRLAVADASNLVRVFDLANGRELLAISSHSDWVTAIAWSADGTQLASGSRDKTAKVFDAKTGKLIVTYSGHSDAVNGVAFHPNGNDVVSTASDRRIHQWKIADGKKSADVATLGGDAYKITIGGDMMFVASADKTVRQYERESRKAVRSYSGHVDSVISTAFHEDTRRLAAGAFNGEVRVWNTEDGKLVFSFTAAPGLNKK